jgi:hypothetical protein
MYGKIYLHIIKYILIYYNINIKWDVFFKARDPKEIERRNKAACEAGKKEDKGGAKIEKVTPCTQRDIIIYYSIKPDSHVLALAHFILSSFLHFLRQFYPFTFSLISANPPFL